MIQKFYPYYEWEDYKCGMYDELKEGRTQRIELAINLLSNCMNLYKYMTMVVTRWTIAAEQVMTDTNRNRKSWLGQAACNIFAGIKEDETREAWKYLSDEQRNKANATAEKVINEWVNKYEKNVRDDCVRSGTTTYCVDI